VALAIMVRQPANQAPAPVREPEATPTAGIKSQMPARLPTPEDTERKTKAPPSEQAAESTPGLERGPLPWEEKIESVLRDSSLGDTAKARRLLAMLPTLPEDGLAAAAEASVARVHDPDYNAVALPVVANPQTHGAAESVLFADLMERPDAIALPGLLRIAQIPEHPYAKNAMENLGLLLDADFGRDWPKWNAAIRAALARNGE
jgi:hypothetical protein